MKNISWAATTTWVRYDKEMSEFIPCSRWAAFKALFTGKLRLYWFVPATSKNKNLVVKPAKKES